MNRSHVSSGTPFFSRRSRSPRRPQGTRTFFLHHDSSLWVGRIAPQRGASCSTRTDVRRKLFSIDFGGCLWIHIRKSICMPGCSCSHLCARNVR